MMSILAYIVVAIITVLAGVVYTIVLLNKIKKGKLIVKNNYNSGQVDVINAQEELINIKTHLKLVNFVIFGSALFFLFPWTILFEQDKSSLFLVISLCCFLIMLIVGYLVLCVGGIFKVKK